MKDLKIQTYYSRPVTATIKPEEALKSILDSFPSEGEWIEETDGKYYVMEECSAGCHSFDRQVEETTKEAYEFRENLRKAWIYLRDKRVQDEK